MKIIVDERETSLYDMCLNHECFNKETTILEKRVLQLGDILFTSDDETTTFLCIERKSLQDLLASIKDGRYSEQSYRLTNCFPNTHNVIYLLEGMLSTVNDKKLVISCIASLNYFKGFSVHRTVSLAETALYILCMADKIERDFRKGVKPVARAGESSESTDYCGVVKVSKKANITKENIGELILMQIPGISSAIAVEIMKPFSNLLEFIDCIRSDADYLSKIKVNGRKIGSNVVKSIQELILQKS
jgi:ERCC4-type nuclease